MTSTFHALSHLISESEVNFFKIFIDLTIKIKKCVKSNSFNVTLRISNPNEEMLTNLSFMVPIMG